MWSLTRLSWRFISTSAAACLHDTKDDSAYRGMRNVITRVAESVSPSYHRPEGNNENYFSGLGNLGQQRNGRSETSPGISGLEASGSLQSQSLLGLHVCAPAVLPEL